MQFSKTPGTCTTASGLCARVRGKKFKRWDLRPLKVAQRWDAFVHIFIASMGLRILLLEPAEKIAPEVKFLDKIIQPNMQVCCGV